MHIYLPVRTANACCMAEVHHARQTVHITHDIHDYNIYIIYMQSKQRAPNNQYFCIDAISAAVSLCPVSLPPNDRIHHEKRNI